MGLFSIFSKEKKETLDKGLEKTKESFLSKIARAVVGKTKVDDEVLDNLEEVLITSDVGVDTTLRIIERIEKRVAKDKYVNTEELNAILKDEIASLLEENNTTDEEVEAWLRLIAEIKPKQVMVYSLDRDTPCKTLCKVEKEELRKIADRVEALGIAVSVA